ncbi:MAG: homogentisate phytyltransferase [Bacteroidota bacterium]|nr:homogentisate phytyltransferase [Bacteroidota bacterium]
MKALTTLWKFSRPHTIIGSVISIFTLYVIVCCKPESQCLSYLLMALSIGITCNIFIVGINQIADVDIDKINKPSLPIASGELSSKHAKIIIFTALFISLGLALCISLYLFGIIVLAAAIGWAYSMPPFYLKKHHITAALAISMVRGVLLNAGGFMVFNYLVNNTLEMPENVKILTLFIIAFSIVISWFKDLSDMEGDAKYNIKTCAILYSPKTVLIIGHLLVASAYLFTIYMKCVEFFASEFPAIETRVLLVGHIALFALFIINAFSIQLREQQSIKKFYKRFWWFFFAEYVVYLLAYMVKC